MLRCHANDCETTRAGNYAISTPAARCGADVSVQTANAVWLQSRTTGTKYFAASAVGVTNGLDITFNGLPNDDCLVLFVAPASAVQKKMGAGYVRNHFDGRTVFVAGSGSCPAAASQCFENPTAYPPLGGSSQAAISACGSARHAHRPCSVDGTTMLLNTCLIAAPVDAHTPPAPRCSLTGLPCPALAMAGPS